MNDKPIIIAMDFNAETPALALAERLDPTQCRLKIGKELYTACGPQLVRKVQDLGFEVFLDLKFHDIPNTVAGACRAAADLGVWMLNVHASGGQTMMAQAAQAVASVGSQRPLLIGVTVLTSMSRSDLLEVGIDEEPQSQVRRLAALAHSSGLDGVVCSAAETVMLRQQLPVDFCLVTPGIRRPEDASNDQKRVVGPAEAVRNGSNYLVVGRPITQAADPTVALTEFNSALAGT